MIRLPIKNTLAAFMMVSLLAPGFYIGLLPPQEVEAQISGQIIGDKAGDFADDLEKYGLMGMSAATSYVLCAYGGEMMDFIDEMLGGVIDIFTDPRGLTDLLNSVPTNETNSELLTNEGATARNTSSDLYKECVLDPLAWMIKSILIDFITQDMLAWISGEDVEAGAAFITNPALYLQDVADTALQEFLDGSLDVYGGTSISDWLCEPFRGGSLDIMEIFERNATQRSYGPHGKLSCSLGEGFDYEKVVGSGDIEDVGITGALDLVLEGNNPYSAYFNLSAEAQKQVGAVVANEAQLLQYGEGYMSQKCPYGNGSSTVVCTPGQFVANQIDDWLGGALAQLEVADEASEILTAAFAAIVFYIFSDDKGGLLGGERPTGQKDLIDGEPQPCTGPRCDQGPGGGGGDPPPGVGFTSTCPGGQGFVADYQCIIAEIPSGTREYRLNALVSALQRLPRPHNYEATVGFDLGQGCETETCHTDKIWVQVQGLGSIYDVLDDSGDWEVIPIESSLELFPLM